MFSDGNWQAFVIIISWVDKQVDIEQLIRGYRYLDNSRGQIDKLYPSLSVCRVCIHVYVGGALVVP